MEAHAGVGMGSEVLAFLMFRKRSDALRCCPRRVICCLGGGREGPHPLSRVRALPHSCGGDRALCV